MNNDFSIITPDEDEHYTWLADEFEYLETELDMYDDNAMEWEY